MIVYGRAVNWDGIAKLKEPHHGRMMSDGPAERFELTEFCWDPRDDGVHFTCEALLALDRIGFEAARYLHAIYDPGTATITHLDGALRIYSAPQLEERLAVGHLRKAGKAGVRRKIFRIDEPVGRDAFSLISQAFFVWKRRHEDVLHRDPTGQPLRCLYTFCTENLLLRLLITSVTF